MATSDPRTRSKFDKYINEAVDFDFESLNYLPWWRADADVDKTPEDFKRETAERLLWRGSSKTYDDYIREARERFERSKNGPDENSKEEIK